MLFILMQFTSLGGEHYKTFSVLLTRKAQRLYNGYNLCPSARPALGSTSGPVLAPDQTAKSASAPKERKSDFHINI